MHIQGLRSFADCPTVVSVMALKPPPVENADIQDAIHSRFLPARSARFQRRPGIIQPNIRTLREEVCSVNVVVLDKRDMAGESVVCRDRVDLVNEPLPIVCLLYTSDAADER